jgi:tRNA nucleotidyltransferase/poly(A) polymerase
VRQPPPHETLAERWEAVKWLKGFGELALQLGDLDPEFLFTHDEAIEKLLRQVAAEIRHLKAAWEALHDENKLLEITASAPWRKSKTGEGEYVSAELVPTLVGAIKARQGRLYAGEYVYVLSRNGKWVQRYPRLRPQPREGVKGGER